MSVDRRQVQQPTWRSRLRLIQTFAIRDLKARFTVTSLGLVWTLLVPLATVVIYSTVFSTIFRAQAPPMGNGHDGVFAVWFFVGLVTWNVFSQASGAGLNSILGMGAMLQKVFIPSYVPAMSAALTVIIEKMLEASVMLVLLLAFLNVSWTWLLYPVAFAAVGVFATSLGYILGVANIHFRDTGQIFAIVMQLWFFVTPIMYPISMIPEEAHGLPLRALIELNPMTGFVEISRDLLYELRLPSAGVVLYCSSWVIVTATLAWIVYRRRGQDVSEFI